MNKRTVYTKSNASGSSSNYYTYPVSLPREPWYVEEARKKARRANVRHHDRQH